MAEPAAPGAGLYFRGHGPAPPLGVGSGRSASGSGPRAAVRSLGRPLAEAELERGLPGAVAGAWLGGPADASAVAPEAGPARRRRRRRRAARRAPGSSGHEPDLTALAEEARAAAPRFGSPQPRARRPERDGGARPA